MSLKGELTDLSLAELIEFFCNQRKTGRLTVSYPQGPAYFYLQSGSVVHASIGSLRGIEAVYYALTQSNASFNFSTAYEAPAQTINQPWTSVVLEGLRRMDEAIKPRNPFPEKPDAALQSSAVSKPEPSVVVQPNVIAPAIVSPALAAQAPAVPTQSENGQRHATPSPVDALPAQSFVPEQKPLEVKEHHSELQFKPEPAPPKDKIKIDEDDQPKLSKSPIPKVNDAFLSSSQQASRFSHTPWKLAAIFASLVLLIAAIAVPWGWRARGKTTKPAEPAATVNESSAQPSQAVPDSESASATAPGDTGAVQSADSGSPAESDAAAAARKAREARAREEARLKATAENPPATTAQTASAPPPSTTTSGPRKAVVQVTYDENGRVTQASGNDPTALRIARQKRFPPGKAGSTTITIPIN
jgi:hypothetical protein